MDTPYHITRTEVDGMTAIGTSAVAFPILAVAVALLFFMAVKLLHGRHFKVTPSSFLLVVLAPLLADAAIIRVSSFLEFHEGPALFGGYCHVMGPIHDTCNEPGNNPLTAAHAEAGVTRLDCHTGPGVQGQIDVYTVVPHEALHEVLGRDDPEATRMGQVATI